MPDQDTPSNRSDTAHAQTHLVQAPTALYFIVLYQVAGGLLGLYLTYSNYGPPVSGSQLMARMSLYHSLPYAVLVSAGVINGLAAIVIGIGIAMRQAWVRPLFLLIAAETTILMLLDLKRPGPVEFFTVAGVLLVNVYIAFVLYLEPANRYFQRRSD